MFVIGNAAKRRYALMHAYWIVRQICFSNMNLFFEENRS